MGTSGFSYASWRGSLYPQGLSSTKMLSHYCSVMDCVEMHAASRRLPAPSVADRWLRSVSDADFRFTIKSPQSITHRLRLANTGQEVEHLCAFASRLGQSLGPLLFQLPHNFLPNPELLSNFVGELPSGFDHVVEPRSPKWINADTDRVLADADIARCISDDLAPVDGEPPGGGRVVYVRLRQESYAGAELARIARWSREVAALGRDVYLIVRHKDEPGAMRPALKLHELLR